MNVESEKLSGTKNLIKRKCQKARNQIPHRYLIAPLISQYLSRDISLDQVIEIEKFKISFNEIGGQNVEYLSQY